MCSVYGVPCYQGSANISTSCGGWDTGYYTQQNGFDNSFYDDDWGTGFSYVGGNSYYYYDKPFNSYSAKWIYKDDNATHEFMIPESCFNYYPSRVLFYGYHKVTTYTIYEYYCYNGSWVDLGAYTYDWGAIDDCILYDEVLRGPDAARTLRPAIW